MIHRFTLWSFCPADPISPLRQNATDEVLRMTISQGAKLPDAKLLIKDEDGIRPVAMSEILKGRKVVIFGLPGAFTGTCTTSHVPSFMRVAEKMRAKGVDEIICISVNDPYVMKTWGESTGAVAKGITFLADSDGSFTKAIGMVLDLPEIGLIKRSQRYALYAVDGVAQVLNAGEETDACEISGGETLLAAI
jgi:peroxiredoxin